MLIKRGLLGIILFLLMIFSALGQSPKEPGAAYESLLSNMKIRNLSDHFNDVIELSIPDRSGNFSSTQARRILVDFFEDKSCPSFTLSREGSFSDGSLFFLGDLECASGESYRIYIVSRKHKDQWLIHIFKIQAI